MNDVEYFEKTLEVEPWKIAVYGVDELKEPCKKYGNNPYKEVLRKLDPYDARMLYFSAYVPIVENGGDPTELAKVFARAAVCLTAESTKYNYMASVLMYLIHDSIEKKDRFVKTIEAFKTIDWDEVNRFLTTVHQGYTNEAWSLNFVSRNGIKSFENELKKKYRDFEPEFLEQLKYIIGAPIEFFEYFGIDDEMARMLHSYNADALDVDEFVERIKRKATMSPCCFCPCCPQMGSFEENEDIDDYEKLMDSLAEEYPETHPISVIIYVLSKYIPLSNEDRKKLREALSQL